MKIQDIVTLVTNSISPQSGKKYSLYSLPSFDNNQTREELDGSEILSNKYTVPDKCILFNKLNVRFKRVWRIDNIDDNKICSTEFLPLVVDENKVDYQYCYYILISDQITNYLCGQNANTSGSHKRIDPTDFLNIELLTLPAMEEQKRIGQLLCSLDQKIALNRAINDNLEAMAKQLYDYWFVQFDFPNEEGKPYKSSGGKMVWNEKLKRESPEGWEILLVGDILDKVQNTPRLATNEYMTYGQYPIIDQTANIYYAGFTDREDAVSKQFPAVVFGDHSCAVKYVNFPFVRGADGTQIMLSKDDRISVEYLYFATKNIPLREGYARHYSILKESYIIAPTIYIAKLYQKLAVKQFELITSKRKEIIELSKQRDELLPLLMNVRCR